MTTIVFVCAQVVTTNGSALNYDKSLQIYFLFRERLAKKKKRLSRKHSRVLYGRRIVNYFSVSTPFSFSH